jgi:galactosamine-6-phosphate isomerase
VTRISFISKKWPFALCRNNPSENPIQAVSVDVLGIGWDGHAETMHIRKLDSYDAISRQAADLVIGGLEQNRKLLFCAATGSSPTGTYKLLSEENQRRPDLFNEFSVIKLDEWGGIPLSDPGTCETYLLKHLIGPLRIPASRYISFNSHPGDPLKECRKIQEELDRRGSIDICILGIGVNGHIALNEPADELDPHTHRAELSGTTLQHTMVSGMGKKPGYGLTLGMADILKSRMIILIIYGSQKKEITRLFLGGKLTTRLPASLLWVHPRVECLVDQEALE